MQVNSKTVANCEIPNCATYESGWRHRLYNTVTETCNNPTKNQYLNKDHLLRGQMVSADNYISQDLGRLYHTKEKSDHLRCYTNDVFLLSMSVVM